MIENVQERRQKNINPFTFTSLLDRMLDIKDNFPGFATEEQLIHHLCTFYSAVSELSRVINALLH